MASPDRLDGGTQRPPEQVPPALALDLPARRSTTSRLRDVGAAAVWAVTSSASGLLVGGLPLALYYCHVSSFSLWQTVGVTLAAGAGMWAANVLGVAIAVSFFAQRSAKPLDASFSQAANSTFAQQAQRALYDARQQALQLRSMAAGALTGASTSRAETERGSEASSASDASLEDQARDDAQKPFSSMRALLAEQPKWQTQLFRDAAQVATPSFSQKDARGHMLSHTDRQEAMHGGMRQYLPTAPHSRPMESFPQPTRNERVRHTLAQLGQSDGNGFNLIHLYGSPSSYFVNVATVLDGLFVITIDKFLAVLGGEGLWGLFVGAWNGFHMIGGEIGFSHPALPLSMRLNGNRNRMHTDSDSVKPLGDDGDAGEDIRYRNERRSVRGDGGALNYAFRFALPWRPQIFFRRERGERSYLTKVEHLDRAAARARKERERSRNTLQGIEDGLQLKLGDKAPIQDGEAATFFAEAYRLQSIELAEEVTDHKLIAAGLPSLVSTAASVFAARHDVFNFNDAVTLRCVHPEAENEKPTQWVLTYRTRSSKTRRWLASFTGGMGIDSGRANVAQDAFTLTLNDSASVRDSLWTLRSALRALKAESAHRPSAAPHSARARADVAMRSLCQHAQTEGDDAPCWKAISGLFRGHDVGLRAVPVLGSGSWAKKQPSGFSWGAHWQRRSMKVVEQTRPLQAQLPSAEERKKVRARKQEERQLLNPPKQQSLFAGRLLDSRHFGPLGSRGLSVWAEIVPATDKSRQSISFEAVWEQSFGHAYDYESYVLSPLRDAFGLDQDDIKTAKHGDWRVQRTVRLRRTVTAGDEHDGMFKENDELAKLCRPFLATANTTSPAHHQIAWDLQTGLETFFAEHQHQSLPVLVKASGAFKPTSSANATPSSEAQGKWARAMERWSIEVTSEADKVAKSEFEAAKVDGDASIRAHREGLIRRVEATAGLIADEPLATASSKQARLKDVFVVDKALHPTWWGEPASLALPQAV